MERRDEMKEIIELLQNEIIEVTERKSKHEQIKLLAMKEGNSNEKVNKMIEYYKDKISNLGIAINLINNYKP